jgi:hypothetical protein
MPPNARSVTLRRTLEQAQHCVDEALSVVLHDEDMQCAVDDVHQAIELLRGKVMDDLAVEMTRQKLRLKTPFG